jgi:SAM-dependent methyltransferase
VTGRYDERLAGDYWGRIRFDTGTAEDEAVLGMNRPTAVNRAYGDWELSCLDRFLGGRTGLALDAGAGVGRVATHLAARWSVVTVDRALGMVTRCRANLAGTPGIRVMLQGSVLALPLAADRFDAVVCLGVIEHLPEPAERLLLSECLRVLRPGGQLILEVNNARSVLLQAVPDNPFRTGRQLDNGYLCRLVDPQRVAGLLAALGATIEDTAANAFYSLLRHTGAVDDDELFDLALRLDRNSTYGPVAPYVADQLVFSARKNGE